MGITKESDEWSKTLIKVGTTPESITIYNLLLSPSLKYDNAQLASVSTSVSDSSMITLQNTGKALFTN